MTGRIAKNMRFAIFTATGCNLGNTSAQSLKMCVSGLDLVADFVNQIQEMDARF